MIVRRTSLSAAKIVPWANGRGVTREVLREDGPDGRFRLRLSVADVVEPGPFSKLPGIDRLLTLIEGPGFDLSIDGRAVAVRLLEPVAFAGEAEAAAVAVPGPSRDFNVMTDRAAMRASVAVHREGFKISGGRHILLIVEGAFGIDDATLEAGDLVELRLWPGTVSAVEGEGALIAVTVLRA